MAVGAGDELMEEAKRHLTEGRFQEAAKLAEAGLEREPGHEGLMKLHMDTLVARGVLQASKGSKARLEALAALSMEQRAAYRDSDKVVAAFDAAIKTFGKVLESSPSHPKAHMMLAGALLAKDREGLREEAVRTLEAALEDLPGNEDLMQALKRVSEPCARCEDTGLCRTCLGGGDVTGRFFTQSCDDCFGKGSCSSCGIL